MNQVEALRLSVMLTDDSLTPHGNSIQSFEAGVDTEVVVDASSTETAELGLGRERVSVEMQAGSLEIHCEFPKQSYLERFAFVIDQALQCVGPVERVGAAVGIRLLSDLDGLAFSHLGSTLISPKVPLPENWLVRGGFGVIGLQDDAGRAWTVVAEPRFRDVSSSKLFLYMAMADSAPEPDAQRILALLDEVWRIGHEQMARMSQ